MQVLYVKMFCFKSIDNGSPIFKFLSGLPVNIAENNNNFTIAISYPYSTLNTYACQQDQLSKYYLLPMFLSRLIEASGVCRKIVPVSEPFRNN